MPRKKKQALFEPVLPQPATPELLSMEQIRAGVDETLRDLLDEAQIRELALNLYEMTKRKKNYVDRNPCRKAECPCKHFRTIEVDNVEGSLKAMELLFNRMSGRPGQASGDDAGVIVKLVMVGVDE